MKKYISVGAVCKVSTEHIVYVSHCGMEYILTAELAGLWLDGRFRFATAENALEYKYLDQLRRMGLVILADDTPAGEYRALTRVRLVSAEVKKPYAGLTNPERITLTWIRDTGLVISMAELVYLLDRDVKPEPRYLGKENVQTLVERIYTRDTIFDNILENQMEHSAARDNAVQLVLSLLRKKRIVLL